MKDIGYLLIKKPRRLYILHECASSCARLVARKATIHSQLRNTPLLNVYPVEPAMQEVAQHCRSSYKTDLPYRHSSPLALTGIYSFEIKVQYVVESRNVTTSARVLCIDRRGSSGKKCVGTYVKTGLHRQDLSSVNLIHIFVTYVPSPDKCRSVCIGAQD